LMTGMAPGVQGIAFSLLSLDLEPAEQPGKPPMPQSIDALISLAVKDPIALVQMTGMFFPPLAQLELPSDGTPVQLPLPIQLSFPVMAAVNGSHLTVYSGEKSQALAQGLGAEALDSSRGIMAADIDYAKYYGLLGDTLAGMTADAQDPQTQAVFEAMKETRMRLQMNMAATERGIEIKADMITAD